ncbi:hypothetical protein KO05_14505, partial [Listeria monocytogenes]
MQSCPGKIGSEHQPIKLPADAICRSPSPEATGPVGGRGEGRLLWRLLDEAPLECVLALLMQVAELVIGCLADLLALELLGRRIGLPVIVGAD